MTATAAQLARRVGLRLRVIDEGESLQATQQTDIVQAIDDLRAELLELGLCWWESSAIPDSVCGPLADWVAYEIAPAFGKQRDLTMREDARRRLNALSITEQRPVQTAEFF